MNKKMTYTNRDKVVEIAVGGWDKLECSEADVVESLIIDAKRLVCVLDQLVDGEGGVVGFNHSVRDLHTSRANSQQTQYKPCNHTLLLPGRIIVSHIIHWIYLNFIQTILLYRMEEYKGYKHDGRLSY